MKEIIENAIAGGLFNIQEKAVVHETKINIYGKYPPRDFYHVWGAKPGYWKEESVWRGSFFDLVSDRELGFVEALVDCEANDCSKCVDLNNANPDRRSHCDWCCYCMEQSLTMSQYHRSKLSNMTLEEMKGYLEGLI